MKKKIMVILVSLFVLCNSFAQENIISKDTVDWNSLKRTVDAKSAVKIYYKNQEDKTKDKKFSGIAKDSDESGDINYWKIENGLITEWSLYFNNSTELKSILSYKNGVENGKYYEYFLNGKVKKEMDYVNGKPTKRKVFNEQGELKEEKNME